MFIYEITSNFSRMRNISNDSFRENENTLFFNDFFLNRAVYEIKWKNMVQPERPQITT